MNKFILYAAYKRFMEITGSCVLLSAVISFLCKINALPDGSRELVIGLYIAAALFVAVNIWMMRACYYVLRNTKVYFLVNYGAYLVFGLVTALTYKLFSAETYTWLFAVTKFARYTNLYLPTVYSAVIFHTIMGIAIFLAPIGMSWVHRSAEEKYVGAEMVPPRMDEEKIKAANKALEASADRNHSNSLQ
ncbi:MAG: hypothetical protein IJX50_00920 [Clostridia bacterium]|nr:hypothetical protein [Clostridia bacterium]